MHGIPKHYSILLSVGVSLLTAVSCTVAITYYNKAKKAYKTTVLGFCVLGVIALALAFTYKLNVVYVIFMCLTFICIIQAIKVPYTSVVTYDVRNVIEPSKYTLLYNAMASIAAGCSPTVMSIMFENFGWNVSFISLLVVSAVLIIVVIGVQISQRLMMFSFYKDKIKYNELIQIKG